MSCHRWCSACAGQFPGAVAAPGTAVPAELVAVAFLELAGAAQPGPDATWHMSMDPFPHVVTPQRGRGRWRATREAGSARPAAAPEAAAGAPRAGVVAPAPPPGAPSPPVPSPKKPPMPARPVGNEAPPTPASVPVRPPPAGVPSVPLSQLAPATRTPTRDNDRDPLHATTPTKDAQEKLMGENTPRRPRCLRRPRHSGQRIVGHTSPSVR